MQEERVRRQTERTKTLGSGAAREMLVMGIEPTTISTPSRRDSESSFENIGSSWFGGAASSMIASTLGAPTPSTSNPQTTKYSLPPDDSYDLSSDDDDDVELSSSQIQLFESENAQMLRQVEDNLAAVHQAESRLLEISALQMKLVEQLTIQNEQTETIYDDAIATTEMVEKGNVQLREARRRMRDSRMWILLFLIGASLSLLFLHYY